MRSSIYKKNIEKFLAFDEEWRPEDRKSEFEMEDDEWFPDDMDGYEVKYRTILKGKLK